VDTSEPSSGGPQIASPCLHPPSPSGRPPTPVEPHLHLTCDLLPCPHRGHYTQTGYQNGEKYIGSQHSDKGEHSNIDQKYSTGQDKEDNSGRDKIADSKVDNVPLKQYLEAEKPDVDKNEDGKGQGQKVLQKGDHSDLENIVKDIMKSDTDSERPESQGRCDSDRSTGSKHSTSSRHSKHSDSSHVHKHSGTKHEEPGSRRQKGQQRGPDQQHRGSKTEDKGLQGQSKDGNKPNKNHVSRGDAESSQTLESDRCQAGVMKPAHSSSPVLERRGISAAIGQVSLVFGL